MYRFTYILVALVLVTLGFSFGRRAQPFAAAYFTDQTNAKSDKIQDAKRHFPTAVYDEPDLADAKKEKQKRYNGFRLVSIEPQPWKVETLVTSDSLFAFPALPVIQSEFIFIGTVESATAHLSQNKKNVFSEFAVAISLFKRLPINQ
jgi:hypothetical protein